MLSIRKWVRQIAAEAAQEAVEAKWDAVAKENAAEPVNIDSELDDGIILLYAREKRLLHAKEWREKARAWQVEFETESVPRTLWVVGRGEKTTPVAVAMRRAILEANIEIAEAEKQVADAALKAALKEARHARP